MLSTGVTGGSGDGSASVSRSPMSRSENVALTLITLAALAAIGFGGYGFIRGRFINSIKIATLASGGTLLSVVIARLAYGCYVRPRDHAHGHGGDRNRPGLVETDSRAAEEEAPDPLLEAGALASSEPQAQAPLLESPEPVGEAAAEGDRLDSPEAVLQNCGITINWFTGTSSATLMGAAKCAESFGQPALVPTGLLLQMGIVPLTGELAGGIIDGPSAVNHACLSGVMWHNIEVASKYATSASTDFSIDPDSELRVIELFIKYGNMKKRTEIALRRLSLYPTPPNVNRQKIAQDLESMIQEPELIENWQNYLGWVGELLPPNVKTEQCTNSLVPGQLVVVKRSSGKLCYGIVVKALRNSDADETHYTIVVETQSLATRYYSNTSDILVPDTSPEEKLVSHEVQRKISSLFLSTRGLREAIETFKNPPPHQEQHPFVTNPFPIVIGADIEPTKLVKVQSRCKEVGARGSVLFGRDVKVIFAENCHHREVQEWLIEHRLQIPVLPLSHLPNRS